MNKSMRRCCRAINIRKSNATPFVHKPVRLGVSNEVPPGVYLFGTSTKQPLESKNPGMRLAASRAAFPERQHWNELSAWQKVKRTGQNAQDLVVVLSGLGIALGVIFFMYREVFQKDSKWSWFSRATERIKNDRICREMLGEPIKAHGDVSRGGGWGIRGRGIRSSEDVDRFGASNLYLVFTVEGKHSDGQAYLHVRKPRNASDYNYVTLSLQVKGTKVYLEGGDAADDSMRGSDAKKKGWLGIRWSW